MKIYLAGGMANLSDEQMKGWRDGCKVKHPEHVYLDPTRRDYRGVWCGTTTSRLITKNDKLDIRRADLVLAYCPRPSWGTAMEIHYAFENLQKWVLVVTEDPYPSPWLVDHSDLLVPTFDEAFTFIDKIKNEIDWNV